MPIKFVINHDAGYFLAEYSGKVTEQEVLREHDLFFGGTDWNPGLNALVDLSRAELIETSTPVIKRIAAYFATVLIKHHAHNVKTAIFAPNDFPFGVSRIYEALTALSPQTVQVFRDLAEAKKWLAEPSDDQGPD